MEGLPSRALQAHSEGMPQDMRGDVLGGDAGTCGGCCRGVDLDAFRGTASVLIFLAVPRR